jgi:hypothetical protein
MSNDISFATSPKHDYSQQSPTQHRSARSVQHNQQSGTVRPRRRSPGGEVPPDTALNCSLTGIRSSNRSTHFARTCVAHEVSQTLLLVRDRVWTYKAGFKKPPIGHHQIHRMKSMRSLLVHPRMSRQPSQSTIVESVSGLPATVHLSPCSNGRSVEARQTIGRRMPPETDPRP